MQLLIFNEEFLVSACHQRALITSLPFVHTARRSYRLNDPVRSLDCGDAAGSPAAMLWEAAQTLSFRGRRSRNKVSVGEPAEGSLPVFPPPPVRTVPSRGVPASRPAPPGVRHTGCREARACPSQARACPAHRLLSRASPSGRPPPRAPLARARARSLSACAAPALRLLSLRKHTTLADGYLGSHNDEERSEMRYVVRIAEFSESSNL